MSLPGSPNFDVLYGPLRFLSIQSDQYFDKGRQVLDAYFRDYALGRVFVMRYINDPSKFKGTIDFVLPDDVHETLEEEAKGHLTAWAARMVGENADVLVLEDDNYTLLQGSRSVVCTPTYEKVSEALKHISIPLEQVCPTGAAEWRAFVLGNWDYAYHPLRFRGEEGLFYNGLHTLLKVQEHPYVLPISRVVVDKDDNLVGWTQIFLPGGDMRRRDIIRTKWILQLLNFVDDMEARYDTQHNDLSPGNILVDPVDDDIRIIDWECANGIILGHAQVEEGAEEDKLDVECALVQLSVFSILTKYTGMPTFDAEAEDFMPSRERMIFKAEKVMALDWTVARSPQMWHQELERFPTGNQNEDTCTKRSRFRPAPAPATAIPRVGRGDGTPAQRICHGATNPSREHGKRYDPKSSSIQFCVYVRLDVLAHASHYVGAYGYIVLNKTTTLPAPGCPSAVFLMSAKQNGTPT